MATLPSGAVALWTFNNINGVVAPDSIGNNNGIIIGATQVVGGGLAFDGIDDYVSIPDSSTWDFGSGDFSISLWANFATPPGGNVGHPGDVFISQDEGAGSQYKWIVAAYPGTIELILYSQVGGVQFFNTIPFNPQLGQWYNIVLTKSGSQWSFYIDGTLAGSAAETPTLSDINAPITIGQSGEAFGGYFNGDLAQVAIFNRALSPADVQQVYQIGVSGGASLQLSTTQAGDTGPFTLSISSSAGVLEPGATVTLSLAGQPNIVSAPAPRWMRTAPG
jgi:hypothetical protein